MKQFQIDAAICDEHAKLKCYSADEKLVAKSCAAQIRARATFNPDEPADKLTYETIIQAVGRGWCNAENEGKVVDSVLALAIAAEVAKLFEVTP